MVYPVLGVEENARLLINSVRNTVMETPRSLKIRIHAVFPCGKDWSEILQYK